MGTKKTAKKRAVVMSVEASIAARRKGPSVARLKKFLNGYDEDGSMPHSWEARWMAARVLQILGYELKKGD